MALRGRILVRLEVTNLSLFSSDSFNMVSGAVGFKVNAFQRLLLDANVLFALDHNGVRDRITPLVGFEYSF